MHNGNFMVEVDIFEFLYEFIVEEWQWQEDELKRYTDCPPKFRKQKQPCISCLSYMIQCHSWKRCHNNEAASKKKGV